MSDTAILQAKTRAMDSINAGFAIIAAIALPLSLSRIVTTGWLPLYSIHIALAFTVIAQWLLRRFLSVNFRFWLTTAVMWLIGVVGLTFFGLMGAGT